MFRKALIILTVITSAASWAADTRERVETGRDISNISELFPSLDTLDCVPRCDGAPICGELKDMNSCLDQGAAADCFWSCE